MNLSWYNYLILFALSTISACSIWFNLNLRYIVEWWKDKDLLTILIFGPIVSFFSYYYWGYAVKCFNSLWSARFVSFSIGIITFTILTWIFMNESPLTIKNSLCIILSIIILLIQIYL